MPQKRNPIASEMMLASAKIVREQHSAMLDAMVQDHERATGQWHVEWQALPTAFIVASGGLSAAVEALEGLDVRPHAMARVLNVTQGLIVAEAVMMGLAPRLGRQKAHDLVYDCCRTALTTGKAFDDALLDQPEIAAVFERAEHELGPETLRGLSQIERPGETLDGDLLVRQNQRGAGEAYRGADGRVR